MIDESIRQNINTFYSSVEMPGGYMFNHVDTLKRIDLYYNSKFESGSYDSKGFKKFFYNIVKAPCDIAKKFIDLDTKDLILVPEGEGNEYKIYLMQKELRDYLKRTKFGVFINNLLHAYPIFGHFVIKKDGKGKWDLLNIQNIRSDPSSPTLKESSFVYELLRMSRGDIESMEWDKTEVEKLLMDTSQEFIIYECYHKEGKKYNRYFKSDLYIKKQDNLTIKTPEAKINDTKDYLPAITLYSDIVDALPYRELKWDPVPGRWLGLGFVEDLFDNQIRQNELTNIKARGLFWSSMKIFSTRDESVGRNVMTDIENGDIIKTTDQIIPIAVEERNLPAFAQEEQRWDISTERKTFSFDISRGENLPSATPLGVANLQAGMVASYFELKREKVGLFLRELFLDDIIPSFQKTFNKAHILTLLQTDQERGKLESIILTTHLQEATGKFLDEFGFMPEQVDIDAETEKIKSAIAKRRNLFFDLPADFYKDVSYVVDIITTGEQIDIGRKGTILQGALQAISTNPALVQNPVSRAIFFKFLELGGISPVELELMKVEGQDAFTPPPAPKGGIGLPSTSGLPSLPGLNTANQGI